MTAKIPWLQPGEPFPPIHKAWNQADPAPGLLAAGGSLDVHSLMRAYTNGIFPWFSKGQPILWWSPDPRMVLVPAQFKLHRSLRKTLTAFRANPSCEIRFDSAFDQVIRACSASQRPGQDGTWIVEDMVLGYQALHAAGYAHSVETWVEGELVGALYGVAIGSAVFGESMFTRGPDASKIALAALVAFCLQHQVSQIDCQQNTRHLASLGACEVSRAQFLTTLHAATQRAALPWKFEPVYWNLLFQPPLITAFIDRPAAA